MNGKSDLHDKFIEALHSRLPKKERVTVLAETLKLEKDAIYRRLNGKVNFSVREMGIVADQLDISLDQLRPRSNDFMWLHFVVEFPHWASSKESVYEFIDSHFDHMERLDPAEAESGNIYCSIPMEYFLHSPVLTKLMFFKWGYYFIGTREFYNYSGWELPPLAEGIFGRLSSVYNFRKVYYIWDISLISSLVREICNFYNMLIITGDEKEEMKKELKVMLNRMEQSLSGQDVPGLEFMSGIDFYVSSIRVGFTSNYFRCGGHHRFLLHTPFSFCMVDHDPKTFHQLKTWADSFLNISTLLSRSGRVERRRFFEEQHKTIDFMMN